MKSFIQKTADFFKKPVALGGVLVGGALIWWLSRNKGKGATPERRPALRDNKPQGRQDETSQKIHDIQKYEQNLKENYSNTKKTVSALLNKVSKNTWAIMTQHMGIPPLSLKEAAGNRKSNNLSTISIEKHSNVEDPNRTLRYDDAFYPSYQKQSQNFSALPDEVDGAKGKPKPSKDAVPNGHGFEDGKLIETHGGPYGVSVVTKHLLQEIKKDLSLLQRRKDSAPSIDYDHKKNEAIQPEAGNLLKQHGSDGQEALSFQELSHKDDQSDREKSEDVSKGLLHGSQGYIKQDGGVRERIVQCEGALVQDGQNNIKDCIQAKNEDVVVVSHSLHKAWNMREHKSMSLKPEKKIVPPGYGSERLSRQTNNDCLDGPSFYSSSDDLGNIIITKRYKNEFLTNEFLDNIPEVKTKKDFDFNRMKWKQLEAIPNNLDLSSSSLYDPYYNTQSEDDMPPREKYNNNRAERKRDSLAYIIYRIIESKERIEENKSYSSTKCVAVFEHKDEYRLLVGVNGHSNVKYAKEAMKGLIAVIREKLHNKGLQDSYQKYHNEFIMDRETKDALHNLISNNQSSQNISQGQKSQKKSNSKELSKTSRSSNQQGDDARKLDRAIGKFTHYLLRSEQGEWLYNIINDSNRNIENMFEITNGGDNIHLDQNNESNDWHAETNIIDSLLLNKNYLIKLYADYLSTGKKQKIYIGNNKKACPGCDESIKIFKENYWFDVDYRGSHKDFLGIYDSTKNILQYSTPFFIEKNKELLNYLEGLLREGAKNSKKGNHAPTSSSSGNPYNQNDQQGLGNKSSKKQSQGSKKQNNGHSQQAIKEESDNESPNQDQILLGIFNNCIIIGEDGNVQKLDQMGLLREIKKTLGGKVDEPLFSTFIDTINLPAPEKLNQSENNPTQNLPQNPYNQQFNSAYRYTEEDIQVIGSQLLGEFKEKNVEWYSVIQPNDLPTLSRDGATVCLYTAVDKEHSCWVPVAIHKKSENYTILYYRDAFGNKLDALENAVKTHIKSVQFASHYNSQEQIEGRGHKDNDTDSAIYALNDARIIAEHVASHSQNPQEGFNKLQFTQETDIPKLRKEFGSLYWDYHREQMENEHVVRRLVEGMVANKEFKDTGLNIVFVNENNKFDQNSNDTVGMGVGVYGDLRLYLSKNVESVKLYKNSTLANLQAYFPNLNKQTLTTKISDIKPFEFEIDGKPCTFNVDDVRNQIKKDSLDTALKEKLGDPATQDVHTYCKGSLTEFLLAYHQNELIQLEDKLRPLMPSPYTIGILKEEKPDYENYPNRFFLKSNIESPKEDGSYQYTLQFHFPEGFQGSKEGLLHNINSTLKANFTLGASKCYLEIQGTKHLNQDSIKQIRPVFLKAEEFLKSVANEYLAILPKTEGDVIWGGNTELGEIANFFGLRSIRVYNRNHVFLLEVRNKDDQGAGVINLQRVDDSHYNCYRGEAKAKSLIKINSDGSCMFTAAVTAIDPDLVSDSQNRIEQARELRQSVADRINNNQASKDAIAFQFKLLFDAEDGQMFTYRRGDLPPGKLRNQAEKIHKNIRETLMSLETGIKLVYPKPSTLFLWKSNTARFQDIYAHYNAGTTRSPLYQYQGTDIRYVGNQLSENMPQIQWVGDIGRGRSSSILNAEGILPDTIDRPILGVYNIGGFHWVAFTMYRMGNSDEYIVLYNDSLFPNAIDKSFRELLGKKYKGKIHYITHKTKNQMDGTSCGVFALNNATIMAQHLGGLQKLSLDKIEQEINKIKFTQQNEIQGLRNHFGNLYLIESALQFQKSYTASMVSAAIRRELGATWQKKLQQQDISIVLTENRPTEKKPDTTYLEVQLDRSGEDLLRNNYRYRLVFYLPEGNQGNFKQQFIQKLIAFGFVVAKDNGSAIEIEWQQGDKTIIPLAIEKAENHAKVLVENIKKEHQQQEEGKYASIQGDVDEEKALQIAIKESLDAQQHLQGSHPFAPGLDVPSVNANLAMITKAHANPSFFVFPEVIEQDMALFHLMSWYQKGSSPYYVSIIKLTNAKGRLHAVLLRASRSDRIEIIDPQSKKDSEFIREITLLASSMRPLGAVFVAHAGIQPLDQATCADVSLILLKDTLENPLYRDEYGEKLKAQLQYYAKTGTALETAKKAINNGYLDRIHRILSEFGYFYDDTKTLNDKLRAVFNSKTDKDPKLVEELAFLAGSTGLLGTTSTPHMGQPNSAMIEQSIVLPTHNTPHTVQTDAHHTGEMAISASSTTPEVNHPSTVPPFIVNITTPSGLPFIPMDVYGEALQAQLQYYAKTGTALETAQKALDSGYTAHLEFLPPEEHPISQGEAPDDAPILQLDISPTLIAHASHSLDPVLAAQADYYNQTGIAFNTLQNYAHGHVAVTVDDQIPAMQHNNVIHFFTAHLITNALSATMRFVTNLAQVLAPYLFNLTEGLKLTAHLVQESSGSLPFFRDYSFTHGGHIGHSHDDPDDYPNTGGYSAFYWDNVPGPNFGDNIHGLSDMRTGSHDLSNLTEYVLYGSLVHGHNAHNPHDGNAGLSATITTHSNNTLPGIDHTPDIHHHHAS